LTGFAITVALRVAGRDGCLFHPYLSASRDRAVYVVRAFRTVGLAI
jgi:hypothetical protein